MLSRLVFTVVIFLIAGCATKKNDTYSLSAINDLAPTHSSAAGLNIALWKEISGKHIRSLTRNKRYPDNYDLTNALSDIDFVESKGDRYAQRIQAVLNVNVSGYYQFWIAADDSAELWLSTDHLPENKRLIAHVNRPSGYKIWDRYKTQKSHLVQLESDKDYYVEVLHKEHKGVDYLSVAWSGPDFEMQILGAENLGIFTRSESSLLAYENGYHNGYQAGSLLAPYDNRNPSPDTDNDGLPDFYENIIGLDSNNPLDADFDSDGDLLTNKDEFALLTNPTNNDTDADGIPDGFEVLLGLSAVDASDAFNDLDSDGVDNITEYLNGTELDSADSYPVKKNIALSWGTPTKRGDGTVLESGDIKGYKIYLGSDSDSMKLVAMIDGHAINNWEMQDLEEGIYSLCISTVTTNGNEGLLSEPIQIQI